jgi:hypothetical protein
MYRTQRSLRPGRELRYRLSLLLLDTGRTLTTAQLVAAMEEVGFPFQGRPSKVIADALRWEVKKGRVRYLGRAHYRTGTIPPTTVRWMRREVADAVERRRFAAATAFERQLAEHLRDASPPRRVSDSV